MNKDLELRQYEARDIPRGVEMIMTAVPQMPNYAMLRPDRGKIEFLLKHQLTNGLAFAGWVLCDSHDVPQGFGAAWAVQSLVSYDVIGDDVFFWIEPEYRTYRNASKLYQILVDWCKARGARLIRASHTGGAFPPDSREGKLYDALLQRQGFHMVGNIYHYGER
jgi:GNAT superfamily N-acetyltransferase